MAPSQRVVVQSGSGRRSAQPKGFIRGTYDALTSAENQSMVRSLAFFSVATAFLASDWAEWLLVPQ